MSRIIRGEWGPILALTLIVIIFSGTALLMPWWSVNISSEASSLLDSSMKTDYYLYQTVTAVTQTNGTAAIQSVPLNNLTESQENARDLSFSLSATYFVTLAGLGLSCLMLILIVLQGFGRISTRYLPFIGYIAAILLFIAPVYLASNFPTSVPKLSTLTPVSAPSGWMPISPADIKGFWGGMKIQTNSNFPEWASDGNFWVWGADAGWYFAFTASLLVAVSSLLIRTITKKKVVVE